MTKVLIVEDESEISESVSKWLTSNHYRAEVVNSGEDALQLLSSFSYDLIILDININGTNGLEVLRQFRNQGGTTPVLMLTGEVELASKLKGFSLGADDYLTKPFSLEELLARLMSLKKRVGLNYSEIFEHGDLVLNAGTRRVCRSGEDIKLFPKEFDIFELLMRNQNNVLRTEEIIRRIWTAEEGASSETLRTAISRLRKKIERQGENAIIENIPSVGYIIRSAADRKN